MPKGKLYVAQGIDPRNRRQLTHPVMEAPRFDLHVQCHWLDVLPHWKRQGPVIASMSELAEFLPMQSNAH